MTVIKYPLTTEKSIRMMESENKLIFVVEEGASKPQIKAALEELLDAQITRVNTHNTFQGKKAIVTFGPDTPAIDVATTLGLM